MRNVKKIFLYMLAVISSLRCTFWDPFGIAGAIKEVNETVKTLDPITGKLTDCAVKTAEIISPAAVAASEGIGYKATQALADSITKVGTGGVIVAGVGVAVYGVTSLAPIAKEIKSAVCPTEKEIAQEKFAAENALERYDAISSRRKFRACLLNNRTNLERGPSGRPTICDEAAEFFAHFAGLDEVNKMTTTFNYFRK